MWLHVVAEVARSDQRQCFCAVPSFVGGCGDDSDTLAVAQALGGDGLSGVVLEHDDQVWGGGKDHPVRLREKMLVLEEELEGAAVAFDSGATTREARRGRPLDVDHLSREELPAGQLRDGTRDRVLVGTACGNDRLADGRG